MDEFNIAVKDILTDFINNLQVANLSNDSIIGFYYIKNHIENGALLLDENIQLIKVLTTTLDEKYEKNDLKIIITIYLLKSILDNKNKNIEKEFFTSYINFQNLQNILDNKDLITMLYPQDMLSKYLENFNYVIISDNFFEKSLEAKEKIIYIFHYITVQFYERSEKAFKEMYRYLYKLFLEAIEKNDEEVAFYLYFPLQFSWNGVATTQDEFKVFNDEVEKPLEKYIKTKLIPKYKIEPVKKEIKNKKVKKIAFLQERLINYSIYRVLYSLLKSSKQSLEEEYEVVVLDINFPQLGGSDKTLQKEIEELGFKYIECHEKFFNNKNVLFTPVQKCLALREMIVNMEIDILIGMHSQPEYNFLFTTRTAPLQIYWSHGNYVYDLKNIDYKLKHGTTELKEEIIHKNSYLSINIPLNQKFQYCNKNIKLIEEEKEKYPKNSIVLGTIGRLSKVDCFEYLNAVIKIMEKNEDLIYCACGSGDKNSIISKIKEINSAILDKFYFPGVVDPSIYGYIINIWLDTFPNQQGVSKVEAGLKGCPIVVRADKEDKRETDIKLYNEIIKFYSEYKHLNTDEAYINFAIELIKNKPFREFWSNWNKENYEKVYSNKINDNFKKFLKRIIS